MARATKTLTPFPRAVAVRREGKTDLFEPHYGGRYIGGINHQLRADAIAVLRRVVEVVDRVSATEGGQAIVCRRDGRLYPSDVGCRRRQCLCVNERLLDVQTARRADEHHRVRCR